MRRARFAITLPLPVPHPPPKGVPPTTAPAGGRHEPALDRIADRRSRQDRDPGAAGQALADRRDPRPGDGHRDGARDHEQRLHDAEPADPGDRGRQHDGARERRHRDDRAPAVRLRPGAADRHQLERRRTGQRDRGSRCVRPGDGVSRLADSGAGSLGQRRARGLPRLHAEHAGDDGYAEDPVHRAEAQLLRRRGDLRREGAQPGADLAPVRIGEPQGHAERRPTAPGLHGADPGRLAQGEDDRDRAAGERVRAQAEADRESGRSADFPDTDRRPGRLRDARHRALVRCARALRRPRGRQRPRGDPPLGRRALVRQPARHDRLRGRRRLAGLLLSPRSLRGPHDPPRDEDLGDADAYCARAWRAA